MTIGEVLETLSIIKPHPFARKLLLSELTRLDGRLTTEVLAGSASAPLTLPHYDETTDEDTVLLAPEPYDLLYLHYLCAKVDYWNGETERCNCDTALFTEVWNAYAAQVVRTGPVHGARILM